MTPSATRRTAINSSAAHVFEVLRFVAENPVPLGVTEISRQLGLPASTVYRALITLEEADYLQRYQNTTRYQLGTTPHLINRALFNRFALHRASRRQLFELAQATGETVSLWVRLGWFALRIGGAFGSRDTVHQARLGEAIPLGEGTARIILALLSPAEQIAYAAFMRRHHPGRHVEETWALEPEAIEQALSNTPGFRSVTVAIRDVERNPVAALSLEGPERSDPTGPAPRASSARDTLEAMIAARPDIFASPFSHIASDDIILTRLG